MGRLFGTDGVRGTANEELTPLLAMQLGQAGAYVLTKEIEHKPTIMVGCDTRISGDMLANALMAGVCSVGANAVYVGVVPTPAVAYLTRKYKVDAGVVISASHNPVEFNGIKFFDGNGYKLPDELEDEIECLIQNNMQGVNFPTQWFEYFAWGLIMNAWVVPFKIFGYVVVLLMALAIIYAAYTSVVYWPSISV